MAQTQDLTLEQAVSQSPRKWVYLFEEGDAEAVDARALERARHRGRAVAVRVGLEHRPHLRTARVLAHDARFSLGGLTLGHQIDRADAVTPDVRLLFGMKAFDPAGDPQTPSNP